MTSTQETAEVVRFDTPPEKSPEVPNNWSSPPWDGVPPLSIGNFMGERPQFIPSTSARLAWDTDALYAIFLVEDAHVRAVARQHQDSVCQDSCVELFFSPGEDISQGYFNLEINCGGTMLFNFQKKPREDSRPLPRQALDQVEINRTLPAIVEPEIKEPLTWCIECRLPFEILQPYLQFDSPRIGDVWRANLFKCGDNTSNPHWLTWSPIDLPRPDFHVPEAFGNLIFV